MESDGDFRLENGVMEMKMGEMNKVLVSLMSMLSISRICIISSSKMNSSSCSIKKQLQRPQHQQEAASAASTTAATTALAAAFGNTKGDTPTVRQSVYW